MPFAPEFDDVYMTIKSSVESTSKEGKHRCFRLDESRPAGRITDRLLAELRSASLCIADLTGTRPNVMWEIGFAMALAKPTILITQNIDDLPFDIKDMQTISYDRNRLNTTLATSLRQSIVDTLACVTKENRNRPSEGPSSEDFGALLTEVSQLREMMSEAMRAWKGAEPRGSETKDQLGQVIGNWVNQESGSHLYTRLIGSDLVTSYCYSGNKELTGVYYAWRRIGEYWFARYKWLNAEPSGFTFLRVQSPETLAGAWWSSEDEVHGTNTPPKHAGVPSTWIRQESSTLPRWAQSFFTEVERDGLAAVLARSG